MEASGIIIRLIDLKSAKKAVDLLVKNPNPSPIPLVHVTFLVEKRKPKNDSFSIEKVTIEIFSPYLMK